MHHLATTVTSKDLRYVTADRRRMPVGCDLHAEIDAEFRKQFQLAASASSGGKNG